MKSKIRMEYGKLKPYLSMMLQNVRKILVNWKLRSILDYGLPLYMGESESTRRKLESAYMTLNRIIHGGLTFKVSKVNICKKIKCELPAKYILKTLARFIQKHLYLRKCPAILEKMVIPKCDASIIYKSKPQLGVYLASLDRLVQLHNRLPQSTKSMKLARFKKYLIKNDLKPI